MKSGQKMRYFNIENNRITYNLIAGDCSRSVLLSQMPKFFIDNFLASLQGKDVLDACCGIGQISQYMSKTGFNVEGVDISEKMILLASQSTRKCKFQTLDVLNLASVKKYDGILAHDCLFHFSAKQCKIVLENFHKALKDSGKLLISFPEGFGEGFQPLAPEVPYRLYIKRYTMKEIEECINGLFQINSIWALNEMADEKFVGKKIFLLLNKISYKEE